MLQRCPSTDSLSGPTAQQTHAHPNRDPQTQGAGGRGQGVGGGAAVGCRWCDGGDSAEAGGNGDGADGPEILFIFVPSDERSGPWKAGWADEAWRPCCAFLCSLMVGFGSLWS